MQHVPCASPTVDPVASCATFTKIILLPKDDRSMDLPTITEETLKEHYSSPCILMQVVRTHTASFVARPPRPLEDAMHGVVLRKDPPIRIPNLTAGTSFVFKIRGGVTRWHELLQTAVKSYRLNGLVVEHVTLVTVGLTLDCTVETIDAKTGVVTYRGVNSYIEEVRTTMRKYAEDKDILNTSYITTLPESMVGAPVVTYDCPPDKPRELAPVMKRLSGSLDRAAKRAYRNPKRQRPMSSS